MLGSARRRRLGLAKLAGLCGVAELGGASGGWLGEPVTLLRGGGGLLLYLHPTFSEVVRVSSAAVGGSDPRYGDLCLRDREYQLPRVLCDARVV